MKSVLSTPAFLRSLKKLSKEELESVKQAARQLPAAFGNPHLHAGLGIRKLRANVFEFRSGLKTRVVFTIDGNDLLLWMAGDHNDAAKWLKNNS
jgi:mRNA-degrading endonuclease RelE of RelBE toxin-antitoxin system